MEAVALAIRREERSSVRPECCSAVVELPVSLVEFTARFPGSDRSTMRGQSLAGT